MAEKKTTKKPQKKKESTPKKKEVQILATGIYKFKANAKAKHLLDGQVYELAGPTAQLLIEKGWGEIID
jgi:hypothetical protein